MNNEPPTVGELREHLVEKATADAAFREQLVADPKAAIKDELGLAIPDGFTVKVHEEQPDTSHLVLPPSAALSETEMEQAAGGTVYKRHNGGWVRVDNDLTFWDDHSTDRTTGPHGLAIYQD